MAATTKSALILDSSVLVNFLRVGRVDLLALLKIPLIMTNHVQEEITTDYPEQLEWLLRALQVGSIQEIIVEEPHEVAEFLHLSGQGIGSGECSAIAVAGVRGWPLALEDRKAARVALARFSSMEILKTQDIMLLLIRGGFVSIAEADALLEDWRTKHRFRLMFGSFKDLL